MLGPLFIKSIAKKLAVLVFALSIAGPVSAVGHTHHGDAKHATSHSNITCVWMCAASSFVGAEKNHLSASFTLLESNEARTSDYFLDYSPRNYRTRAPPIFL